MYVLDTNTLIYFFKGVGQVSQRLLACNPQQVAIPAIVLHELEVGIRKSTSPTKRRKQLQSFCRAANVLPLGEVEAREAAAIRVALEQQGLPIGPLDVLIAGTARANSGILVTHNVAEFSRVAKLQIEDWY